jgi:hypothetical protein
MRAFLLKNMAESPGAGHTLPSECARLKYLLAKSRLQVDERFAWEDWITRDRAKIPLLESVIQESQKNQEKSDAMYRI